ncbi:UDP-3-O-acyl-N-acetylglucosamine deacetylase [Paenochrobactrum pullorum]|uniref:UDP-3-O-acyl-N-acetylglucosamine deacetylase n=1 Tax=Paenochrobactrum pullorum TaxID=1324351 RepID=UPI0035BC863D
MTLKPFQQTLAKPVMLAGVGVHSGKVANLELIPAAENSGIVFIREDADGVQHRFAAHADQVGSTDLSTTLGTGDIRIHTIEHLMSAVSALGLDNLEIVLDGEEVPILDGSALDFINAFDAAGIEVQSAKRKYIRVLKPVRIEHNGSWTEFAPYDGLHYDVEIEFSSTVIGRQKFAADLDADIFKNEIAAARTFGFMKDVETLWAAGLALGSSLENSLVIGHDDTIINEGGLRLENEFVRHKTLDAIGDLAMLGTPFIGRFSSFKGGHKMNFHVVKALFDDKSTHEIIELA